MATKTTQGLKEYLYHPKRISERKHSLRREDFLVALFSIDLSLVEGEEGYLCFSVHVDMASDDPSHNLKFQYEDSLFRLREILQLEEYAEKVSKIGLSRGEEAMLATARTNGYEHFGRATRVIIYPKIVKIAKEHGLWKK